MNSRRLAFVGLVCLVSLNACGDDQDGGTPDTDTGAVADAGADSTIDVEGSDAVQSDTLEPDAAADATDSGAAAPDCASYCAAVVATCTGENAQYPDEAACLAFCAGPGAFAPGADDATSGNSVACRIYHTEAAATSPEAANMHCEHAGPTGGNVCGTWCDNYCDRAMSSCNGDNALFDDRDACVTACLDFSDEGPAVATAGDSVQCRIYHLGVAGTDALAAQTHCPHAGIDGGGVCVESEPTGPVTCETYCEAVTDACTGENAQYGSEAACLQYCQTQSRMPLGERGATAGNSAACREYHAGVASTDSASAAAHCPHAGPTGANVCGTWCETYCDMSMSICTGDNAQYPDREQCMADCPSYPDTAAPGVTGGNSVQCRIYHLGAAGTDELSAVTHCPHTGLSGGGVCAD